VWVDMCTVCSCTAFEGRRGTRGGESGRLRARRQGLGANDLADFADSTRPARNKGKPKSTLLQKTHPPLPSASIRAQALAFLLLPSSSPSSALRFFFLSFFSFFGDAASAAAGSSAPAAPFSVAASSAAAAFFASFLSRLRSFFAAWFV
jgi:hypothetical protein